MNEQLTPAIPVLALLVIAGLLIILKSPGGHPQKLEHSVIFPPKLTGRVLAIIILSLPIAFVVPLLREPHDFGLWIGFLFFAAVAIVGLKIWSNPIVLDENGVSTKKWGKRILIRWSDIRDLQFERHGNASGHRLKSPDGTELYVDRMLYADGDFFEAVLERLPESTRNRILLEHKAEIARREI